jgi:hypothetical protein
MKSFKQFLTESTSRNVKEFLENIIKYHNILSGKWKKEFPEEPIDAEYMDAEYQRNSYNRWAPPFIDHCIKTQTVTMGNYGERKPYKGISRGCYYNATGYVKKYQSEYNKLDLAFGIIAPKSMFDELANKVIAEPVDGEKYWRMSFDFTIHAFCIQDGNKIIDPTLDEEFNDHYYFYEIVPTNVWESFPWKDNDPDFDGRPLYNYSEKRFDQYQKSFNFVKEYQNRFGE